MHQRYSNGLSQVTMSGRFVPSDCSFDSMVEHSLLFLVLLSNVFALFPGKLPGFRRSLFIVRIVFLHNTYLHMPPKLHFRQFEKRCRQAERELIQQTKNSCASVDWMTSQNCFECCESVESRGMGAKITFKVRKF